MVYIDEEILKKREEQKKLIYYAGERNLSGRKAHKIRKKESSFRNLGSGAGDHDTYA